MTCHGITLAEYVRYIRNELPTQRYNEIHALLHESEELNDTLLSIKYDLKKLQLNHEPDLDAVVWALEREEERRLKNILDMLPLIEHEQALVEQDVDRICHQLQEEILYEPAPEQTEPSTAFLNFKRYGIYKLINWVTHLSFRKNSNPSHPSKPNPVNVIDTHFSKL